MKKVTVVVPLFNEELIVEKLLERLQSVTQGLDYDFEFLIVDDGSKDATLSKLLERQEKEPRLKVLELSRNWGHQNAFNAGIDQASGDAVILMDGDLEDPPEMIVQFLEKWEQGFEVVYTVKESRQRNWLDKILFNAFYRLLRLFSDVDVERNSGMFSLLDRRVLDYLKQFGEKNKYYVGLRSFVGFKQTSLTYHRPPRFAGSPKQTFRRLLNYALNAYFAFSFLPIRMVTYFGLFILAAIILFSAVLFIGRLVDIPFWYFEMLKELPGWTSLVLLILFLMGTQIIFLGILGEYIARIYDEVRERPYYIVREIHESEGKSKE